MERQSLVLAAVVGHLLLTALHGLVHVAIPVFPDGWIALFATVSLYLLPVLGAGLVVGNHRRVGAAVLLSAGAASFVFEGTLHFVVPNPDHIAYVAHHRSAFGVTAILTTVGNLLLVGAAWFSISELWSPRQSISVKEWVSALLPL